MQPIVPIVDTAEFFIASEYNTQKFLIVSSLFFVSYILHYLKHLSGLYLFYYFLSNRMLRSFPHLKRTTITKGFFDLINFIIYLLDSSRVFKSLNISFCLEFLHKVLLILILLKLKEVTI